MSAMAAAPPRLDSVLSFGGSAMPGDDHRPAAEEEVPHALAFSDDDDDDDAGFEFAFAPPLAGAEGAAGLAPAGDLFSHGRILPAYPVFDHHLLDHDVTASASAPQHQQAPPSPDTYCAWTPRSAPGSPARARDPPFPKSSSTGEARRFWRLRDLVSGAGGRSHSDGKEKFAFLQPAAATSAAPSKMATTTKQPSAPAQKQSRTKKGGKKAAGAATEMDMATAHRLFYGKQQGAGGGALAGDRQHSYLPYRPGIVGFFTPAHALGRSHHPY